MTKLFLLTKALKRSSEKWKVFPEIFMKTFDRKNIKSQLQDLKYLIKSFLNHKLIWFDFHAGSQV